MDGAYFVPNFHLRGHLCRTNIASPSGFRGYGSPQGYMGMKVIVNHVARLLGKCVEKVTYPKFIIIGFVKKHVCSIEPLDFDEVTTCMFLAETELYKLLSCVPIDQ